MKHLLFILSFLSGVSALAGNTTFEKLASVNVCWHEQQDVSRDALPAYGPQTEHDWIKTHLALVETTLRNRPTGHLSAHQRNNRSHCLDLLHGYMLKGSFPINDRYTYRTPIFIDGHDNFCAVGYLVKATGHEDVSRMIASKTNLAYVKQMRYPELDAWAGENGFTKDELAWIQPGYAPIAHCGKIGNGVDGEVSELVTDNNKLYVGGTFSMVDGSIPAGNIAWVSESSGTYTWHAMGTGVNGPVHAIAVFDGKVFVGGSFTMAGGIAADNIAYWDATGWHAAGCVNGTVYDLAVFNGNLYAAGEFDDCSFLGKSFAKWNGAHWQFIPGITGRINTMKVKGTSLALGGAFDYGGAPANIIWWNETSSFSLCANNLSNEVMSLDILDDTLYAGCKRTHATDTASLFMKLRIDTWLPVYDFSAGWGGFNPSYGTLAFNTLLTEGMGINIGGQFTYTPMLGTYASNCYHTASAGNWVTVDSAVNKMVMFNGNLVIGGKFKNGNTTSGTGAVNGIAYRMTEGVSVTDVAGAGNSLSVYPQPARTGSVIHVQTTMAASSFTVSDVTGRFVSQGSVANDMLQPGIKSPGVYMLTITGKDGNRTTTKLVAE